MRIIVSTHQGNLYNDVVDYIVVYSESLGSIGIMKNHVPIVTVIDEGYVKLVKDKDEFYVVIVGGVLEFHNNEATILVQEAHIGRSHESAKEHLLSIHNERVELNRKEVVDFTKKEQELRENLRKANAGNL